MTEQSRDYVERFFQTMLLIRSLLIENTDYPNYGWQFEDSEFLYQAGLMPPDATASDLSFSFQVIATNKGSENQMYEVTEFVDRYLEKNPQCLF